MTAQSYQWDGGFWWWYTEYAMEIPDNLYDYFTIKHLQRIGGLDWYAMREQLWAISQNLADQMMGNK